MIKYLGSKRTLVPEIVRTIDEMPGVRTVLDVFSGTSRVGHALKGAGYRVLANDHNAYAATLARCYVQADREDVLRDAEMLVAEFNSMPGRPGYFTETFCERSRYLQPHNGERVDAIRESIASKSLEPELEAVMLVSLMEAADRVDSTTGVQMAYLKGWSARSHNPLALRVPNLLARPRSGKCAAHMLEAPEAVRALEADLLYIDPPYNQHSYLGNYHVWESLVRWDKPEVYGVACKRVDCRDRRSVFNSRPRFAGALEALLGAVRARSVVLSFSDEGFLPRPEVEAMLVRVFAGDREIGVSSHGYKRYVGAQIGIYNPAGEKVGSVGKLRNTEFIYRISSVGEAAGYGTKPLSAIRSGSVR